MIEFLLWMLGLLAVYALVIAFFLLIEKLEEWE